MKNIDTISHHLAHLEQSVDSYLGERRLTLGRWVRRKVRVYLDTKYWILLRNAEIGREKSRSVQNLLAALRAGVASGRILCPVGADTFKEIMSQTDESTLVLSAKLIDELAQGVAVLFHHERFLMELLAFICKGLPDNVGSRDPKSCAWTKVGFILGFLMPAKTALPEDYEMAMQKAFLDQVWEASFMDIVDAIGPAAICTRERELEMSHRLNENKLRYRPGCRSHREAFLSEIAGMLDFLRPALSDTLCYVAERYPELRTSEKTASAPRSVQMLANVIYHAFRLNLLTTDLPFIRIQASLHAAICWDTARRYRPTDGHDVLHAATALPYFNVFLTERSLKHLVTRKDLALDKLYGCCVITEPSDAVQKIQRILNHEG